MLDDLCCIIDHDLFGATSICDPQTAQLIGGQTVDFVQSGDKMYDSDGFPDLNLP